MAKRNKPVYNAGLQARIAIAEWKYETAQREMSNHMRAQMDGLEQQLSEGHMRQLPPRDSAGRFASPDQPDQELDLAAPVGSPEHLALRKSLGIDRVSPGLPGNFNRRVRTGGIFDQ
jgi:hypothetical protein